MLDLKNLAVTDAGLERLKGLTNLRSLRAWAYSDYRRRAAKLTSATCEVATAVCREFGLRSGFAPKGGRIVNTLWSMFRRLSRLLMAVVAALGSTTLTTMPGCSSQPNCPNFDSASRACAVVGKVVTAPTDPAKEGPESARPIAANGRAKELTVDLGKGVKLEMVFIPAGEFLMGSPDSDKEAVDDEKPQHRVRITKPFYLGKVQVTQEQWKAVMDDDPSRFAGPRRPCGVVDLGRLPTVP